MILLAVFPVISVVMLSFFMVSAAKATRDKKVLTMTGIL